MCLALYQYILLCLSIALQPFLLLQYWLPRAKLCSFSAKSDRCDSTTRCSDGPRRCNRGSMKFNTFAEGIFLRLPRSYRVAEKSSQIGSREPNCAVFQQNPIVAQARLDAPMDPDAVIAQAWTSTHLLGVCFSVCRDRTALRRNLIRSLASRDPIAENHEKPMVFIEFLDDATRSSQTEKISHSKCIDGSAVNFVAPEHAWATNGELARFVIETPNRPYYLSFFYIT